MKNFFIFLFTLLLTHVSSAGTYELSYSRTSARLADCGGTVSLGRDFLGELVLSISELENCSNVDVSGESHKIDDSWLFGRTADFVVNESRAQTTFVIRSNSGKTRDTVVVSTRSQSQPAEVVLNLRSCGGTLTAKMETSGQVNLVFRGVQQCSNFDILAHNGSSVGYESKKLQEQNGARGGSFTIPNRFKTSFYNGVLIEVRSNSGKHSDRVEVSFRE